MQRFNDWTEGVQTIVHQECGACGQIWYFRRSFCPQCGSGEIADRTASGRGIVHAATLVSRAPSPELRAYVPYVIVLVDMQEGFRMMAHGEPDLQIGDAVEAGFIRMADRLVPRFRRVARTA